MIPIDFEESNKVLTKPENMTDEECNSLTISTDGEVCTSRWKLSFWERMEVLFRGRIWLMVWSGYTQPPVAITVFYPFIKEKR